MQCNICHRTSTSRLPFNCTTCARNELYGPRIQHAQVLLEAEACAHEVEQSIAAPQALRSQSKSSTGPLEAHPTHAIERLTAERVVLEERTETVLARADDLRKQMEELKVYIIKKKKDLAERRSNLDTGTKRLDERPKHDLEPVEKDIKRTGAHWDALHSRTAEARAFLCREAAQLYGLQQRKRKKGTPGRDFYLIGGIPISDLRDLNSSSFLTIF